MSPPTNNWMKRTEHRFNAEVVTDTRHIKTQNSEHKDT